MSWKKSSEGLKDMLEQLLENYNCVKKKMFGSDAYFVNNNMFAGVHQDTIFLRFSENDKNSIMESYDEIIPFEPMEGRIMHEYLAVPESIATDEKDISLLIRRSFEYASSLPEKKRKKRN